MSLRDEVETAFRLGLQLAITTMQEQKDVNKTIRKLQDVLSNRDARDPANSFSAFFAATSHLFATNFEISHSLKSISK